MKKKLLLGAFMVALLMCLLTVIINAATIPEWTEITEVENMADKSTFGSDGAKGATSRVLMSDGITYPAYYICKNSTTLGISFTDINKNTGKEYKAADVIRIEIPNGTIYVSDALKVANGYTALLTVVIPEGVTKINDYGFKAANASTHSSLVSVTIPSTVNSIGLQAFAYCNSLEELIIPEGVTAISKEMARDATSLNSLKLPSTIESIGEAAFRSSSLACEIVIPEGCTSISSYAFRGSGVTSVTLPSTLETLGVNIFSECNSLITLESNSSIIGENMFSDCDELKIVDLENIVEIKPYAFNHATLSKIETLTMSEGLTTIGKYAFPRLSITSLVLPSTLTSIGENSFYNSTKLERVVVLGPSMGASMLSGCSALKELVLTEKFTTFGSGCMNNVSQTSFTTYYTGTDYDRIKTLCSATTRFSQASYCSYEDYESGNYTAKKFMVIYDCNLCTVAFEGVHTEPNDDGDCTTAVICSLCSDYIYKEPKQHVSSERLTYPSLMEDGEYYVGCTNDGCTLGTTEKADALFACVGYSVAESGNGGITIGYTVNSEAISTYERITGKTVKYGVFVVLQEKLGSNAVFGKNGTAADGVINAEITNHSYSAFELKVSGFTNGQMDTKLAMGAYVAIADDQATEYSYLQEGTANEGESYVFASYNDIIKMLKHI